ncbi:MAG TPA: pyridoxal-phosphate dependent enzyme [Chitinophagales bacterium]|nr:pyridoxal-phosphate dependent enzyme [Chitinophagales bacterium]
MFQLPSPLVQLHDDLFSQKKISFFIKRDDLIHPVVSGNKWRKLKFNMQAAQNLHKKVLLTVGGAFSNHLAATACAANYFSLQSIGIVRGEELHAEANENLKQCAAYGMKLFFVSRTEYAKRYEHDFFSMFMKEHHLPEDEIYTIPEGGANKQAEIGCREIIDEIPISFDYISTAAGTGATARGLLSGLNENQKLLVFPALKAQDYSFLINQHNGQFEIISDYTFGGFAKTDKDLLEFMAAFYAIHQIPLDYVYTGKMLFGIFDLIKKDYFKPGSTLIALHTGGLDNAAYPGI